MSAGVTGSFAQMVIDDEIAASVRRLGRAFAVDADALAADIGGVYSVSQYNAATQSVVWRLPGVLLWVLPPLSE